MPSQSYAQHVANVVCDAVANASGAAQYSPTHGVLMQAAVRLAAEFHDLGKLDEQNQTVLETGNGRLPINHVDAGVASVLAINIDRIRQVAAVLVYAHHAGLPSLLAEAGKGPGKAFRDSSPTSTGLPLDSHTNGLLADYRLRHGSVVSNLPPLARLVESPSVSPLLLRIALSCLVDADHGDTARHYQDPVAAAPRRLEPANYLDRLDAYVAQLSRAKEDQRTRLRSSLYRRCRDANTSSAMLTCDSPVGSGKTTAIMAHLLQVAKDKGLRRVIVVLPFTNIIDQSVDVYRKAFVTCGEDAHSLVAAHHHKADFDDPSSRQFAYLWHAPVVVTTAVQFFETLAAGNPAALRKLHQVPGSAIFVDESHTALPTHLWPQAWKWLHELEQQWGCHVVFGSGSLTRIWELPEFVDPPIKLPELVEASVRQASTNAERHRITYKSYAEPLNLSGLAEFLNGLPGPRLLIVNTVQSAAAIARDLANRDGGEHVEHLSTSLTPSDRKRTLELVKLRLRQPNHIDWTLVATSCVEAGVDMSFRSGIRERCSLTSLLQTAGRINRSHEYEDAYVWDIQLKHDHLLRPHPVFDASARILGELFDEGKVAPEFCTEALRREIRQEGIFKAKDAIRKAELSGDFPLVEELFKVIATNSFSVVADSELVERLEHNEKVTRDELQGGSVQIWQSRVLDWNVEDVIYIPGIKKWTLLYDSFLGYMAGVLPLVDAGQSACFIV